MDKSSVLETAGDPDRTFREDGKDYWTYKYYQDDELKEGQVILKNGSVILTLLNAKDEETMTQPSSFRDYKKKVEQKRESYQKQFKNIDE